MTQPTGRYEPDDLLTAQEVADILGLNVKYVRHELIRTGIIRRTRVGRGGPKAPFRVRGADLTDYIERSSSGGVSNPPRRRQKAAPVA